MRVSAKGRYGLAAMIAIAQGDYDGTYVPVIVIAEKLGLSKIYLEQVFSLLKRAGLVNSIKGAQGGYRLTRTADQINAYEILTALEQMLFEDTETSVEPSAPAIEQAMQKCVFSTLDKSVEAGLVTITLDHLVQEVGRYKGSNHYMFYI